MPTLKVISEGGGVYRAAPCENFWHSQNRFEAGNVPADWVDQGSYGASLPWSTVGSAASYSSAVPPLPEGLGALSLPNVTSGYKLDSDVNEVFKIGATDDFELAFMICPTDYNDEASFILSTGIDFGPSSGSPQFALALSGDGGGGPTPLGRRGRLHFLRHVDDGNSAGLPWYSINGAGDDILVSSCNTTAFTGGVIPLNEFTSVRITRQNGFVFFYMNEVLVNPTPIYFVAELNFSTGTSDKATVIGFAPGTDYNPGFEGHIDNFRLRNERL